MSEGDHDLTYKMVLLLMVHSVHAHFQRALVNAAIRYLKHKGVIELWMTTFPPCFGLTLSSIIGWQQLQFYQCAITLALNRQVSGTQQRHHQLLSLLLVTQCEPQTNS